ncbi:MAG: hypothetical protein HY951_00960 [Bacteroidia bacterium]|nr:hypothetical protein [Bacteroidia bacterium]
MKNILLIILAFLSVSSFCQTDTTKSKIEFGLSVSTVEKYINDFGRNAINYIPQLTFTYGKFTSKVGLKYGPNQIQDGYLHELILKKIRGGIISFQFIPNKKARVFDLYFLSNISILNFKKHEFNMVPGFLYHNETKSMFLIEPTLGYGFKIKFLKNFYFSSDISFGYSFQKIAYTSEPTEKRKILIGNILFGIGYKFKIKKHT